MFIILTRHLKL